LGRGRSGRRALPTRVLPPGERRQRDARTAGELLAQLHHELKSGLSSRAGTDRDYLHQLADSLLVPLLLVDIDAGREAGVDADSLAVVVVKTAQHWRAWGATGPLLRLEEIAGLLAPVAEGSHVYSAVDGAGIGVATGRYGFCTHSQSCGWSIEVVGDDGAFRWACLRTFMIRSEK
jgi:hypothetical protein